ncbi:hypothetical protein Tco_1099068, partial [Tanacetum coccineum]
MAYMNKNYGTLPVTAEQLLDIKTTQAEETVPESQYQFSVIKFSLAIITPFVSMCLMSLISIIFKTEPSDMIYIMLLAYEYAVFACCFLTDIYGNAKVNPLRSILVRALKASYYMGLLLMPLFSVLGQFPHTKHILRLEVLNHSGDPSNKVLLLFGVLIRVHLGVILLHLVSKDILSFHDSSPELLCFPIFMSFAMILYMFDFKTYSIARAIYTHDHDLHDLPPSHGGFMDSSHSSARSSVSHNSVSSDVVVESSVPSGTVLNAFTEEIVAYENDSNETHAVK